ncbi:MAG: polyprenyl synthetase family protein [Candidatus Omnitrophica bacterium]|nr:polyprenyl synthetase family protein [Candidatus Omnitrophota bacterium]
MTTSLSEIYRPIQSYLQASEQLLLKELGTRMGSRGGLLLEMTRHVAQMSGKRIRPALALLGAAIAHEDAKHRGKNGSSSWVARAVKLATAVEMIHTATLLHDDVIDGASLRRGISTVNAKWGDTLSVLSGDFLYSKAFCLLSELEHPAVLRLMTDTTRIVCEGEVAQIQHQYDLMLTRGAYLKIIDWKTASLMGASAQAGALLGGATPARAARLGVFGRSFGLAFQILDDTQDLVGDEEEQGKSLGTDLALGQLTLPLLCLRDAADPEFRSQLTQCFNGNGSRTAAQAREQMQKIKQEAIRLRVPEYCRRAAGKYLLKARQALAPFPESAQKESLLSLTDFLVR